MPVKLRAVNPHYLEYYSLRDKPDESHTVAIAGPDGKTWYRSAHAGLDLSDFRFWDAFGMTDREGKFAIGLDVTDASRNKLRSWSRELIGKHAGVVVHGRLHDVSLLRGEIDGGVRIPGFSDEESVQKTLDAIKAGGLVPSTASRPGK